MLSTSYSAGSLLYIVIVCVLLCFAHVCLSGAALSRQAHDDQLFCTIIMCTTNSFGPINIPYPYPYPFPYMLITRVFSEIMLCMFSEVCFRAFSTSLFTLIIKLDLCLIYTQMHHPLK